MKIKKIVFAVVFICMFLTGCTNSYYKDDQSEEIAAKGETLITEYLDKNCPGYRFINCNMVTGAKLGEHMYSGYYLTDYAEAKYAVGEKIHTIDVNIKNGDIYTDEHNKELADYIKEELKPYLSEAGYEDEIVVDNVRIEYELISKDIKNGKETFDTQAFILGVLPSEFNPDNFDRLISKDYTDGNFYSMIILFHNDENGNFPNETVKKYCEENGFFKMGTIYVYNLSEEDFNDILSGNKEYHYTMNKLEEYSILLGNN